MPQRNPERVFGPSAYRDEPMSEMRRTIAKRLVTSLGPVPHFFLTTEIEMDRAADMRQQINTLYPDAKVSINDVIVKGCRGCVDSASAGERVVSGQDRAFLRTRGHRRRRSDRERIDHTDSACG